MPDRYRYILALLVLVLPGWLGMDCPGKKPLKGSIRTETGLFDLIKGEGACRLDSALGTVLELRDQTINPLFESSRENEVRLWLWVDSLPDRGRIRVPEDVKGLCYREKGNLLMFETFQGTGNLEILERKKNGRLVGKIDLRLVQPHHNFSNADFHYMGGEFILLPEP